MIGIGRAIGTAGLGLAIGLSLGCASNEATVVEVDRAPVSSRAEFRRTLLLTGELEAVSGQPVIAPKSPSSQVNIRWILEDGSEVEAGDKVVELDTTQIIGDVAQKRIDADTALGELKQKQEEIAVELANRQFSVDKARADFEKAKLKAAVPEELIDQRQYQEAQLAAERTKALLENAEANLATYREGSAREIEVLRINLEKARRDIERAEQGLASMVLHAPRAGIFVVGEHPWEGRKFQVGDSVWVGMTIAEIPDLSQMRVRAELSDVDEGKIAVGMPVVCTVDAYPETQVRGEIREIAAVARESSNRSVRRHFPVTVELERSDPRTMRPGMSVQVAVETANREDVLLVPRESLELDTPTPRVLLGSGGTREVTIGECNARVCEVLAGLEEGVELRAHR